MVNHCSSSISKASRYPAMLSFSMKEIYTFSFCGQLLHTSTPRSQKKVESSMSTVEYHLCTTNLFFERYTCLYDSVQSYVIRIFCVQSDHMFVFNDYITCISLLYTFVVSERHFEIYDYNHCICSFAFHFFFHLSLCFSDYTLDTFYSNFYLS